MEADVSEGYGPGDAAVWVACVTDDPERTAAEVRAAFLRHGGWPGAPGSVAYLFKEVGRLVFPAGSRSDPLIRLAWDAGAEDVIIGRDGVVEVRTDPWELESVRSQLERAGFTAFESGVTRRAAETVSLEGSAVEHMRELIEALGRINGVQHIYTNAEVAGEVLESV